MKIKKQKTKTFTSKNGKVCKSKPNRNRRFGWLLKLLKDPD